MTDLPRFETIETERQDEVLRVWLNRPQRRNAHDRTMIEEVGDLFQQLNRAFDVRVVVLGGRGPTFCAGADRREERRPISSERERRWVNQLGRRACAAIEACEAVTIARVQGHAVGGGSCFAVSCDFRVTTHTTRWWVPEVELGVNLPWGAIPRLIQEIGAARARQYIMCCPRIDGRTAEAWGLAHQSVPDDQLDAAVDDWVQRLVDLPPLSLHQSKTHLRGYAHASVLGDLTETDGDLSVLAAQGDAYRERFAAF